MNIPNLKCEIQNGTKSKTSDRFITLKVSDFEVFQISYSWIRIFI